MNKKEIVLRKDMVWLPLLLVFLAGVFFGVIAIQKVEAEKPWFELIDDTNETILRINCPGEILQVNKSTNCEHHVPGFLIQCHPYAYTYCHLKGGD